MERCTIWADDMQLLVRFENSSLASSSLPAAIKISCMWRSVRAEATLLAVHSCSKLPVLQADRHDEPSLNVEAAAGGIYVPAEVCRCAHRTHGRLGIMSTGRYGCVCMWALWKETHLFPYSTHYVQHVHAHSIYYEVPIHYKCTCVHLVFETQVCFLMGCLRTCTQWPRTLELIKNWASVVHFKAFQAHYEHVVSIYDTAPHAT